MPDKYGNPTNQEIMDEIIKSRTEMKDTVSASEKRILKELGVTRERVEELERENTELKNKIENLERVTRKKNIVIFGMERKDPIPSVDVFAEELSSLLKITIDSTDIIDLHSLGNETTSPLKVELLSYSKKQRILSQGYQLKGTEIKIAHDLTQAQREDFTVLKKYLVQARNNNKKAAIKGQRLIIEGKSYTANQLRTEKFDKTPEGESQGNKNENPKDTNKNKNPPRSKEGDKFAERTTRSRTGTQ